MADQADTVHGPRAWGPPPREDAAPGTLGTYADGSYRFPLIPDAETQTEYMLWEMQGGNMEYNGAPRTHDELQAERPPVGNQPFPPRTGYEKQVPTIADVLTIGPTTLRRDTATNQDSGIQGSPRNEQGQW